MADTVWTNGNGDGNFDLDANFSGSKPAANDRVIFNATQTADCTVNTDNLTAVEVDEIIFSPDYTGTVGSTGERLKMSSTRITHRGSGTVYLEDGDTSTADVVIDSGNMTLAAQLYGATFTRVAILNGSVVLTSTFTCTDLFVGFGANVVIQGTSNAIANVYQVGGRVTSARPITTARIMGGEWTQEDAAGLIATLEVGPLARVTYKATGTITLAIVGRNGMLDLSTDSRARTITTARVFPDGQLIRGDALTITNGGSLRSWQTID